jgi:hypothetical protein
VKKQTTHSPHMLLPHSVQLTAIPEFHVIPSVCDVQLVSQMPLS